MKNLSIIIKEKLRLDKNIKIEELRNLDDFIEKYNCRLVNDNSDVLSFDLLYTTQNEQMNKFYEMFCDLSNDKKTEIKNYADKLLNAKTNKFIITAFNKVINTKQIYIKIYESSEPKTFVCDIILVDKGIHFIYYKQFSKEIESLMVNLLNDIFETYGKEE